MYRPFYILLIISLFPFFTFASGNYYSGARPTALSGAFVSIHDTWSTFHNQATLAQLESVSSGVYFESRFLIEELSLAAGSVVLPVRSGTFGLSLYQFGKGSYKNHKVGISFAKKLSDRLNAGIQLDYFSEHYPENEGAFGFATFEVGLTCRLTDEFILGAHMFNPIKNGIRLSQGKQRTEGIYRIGGHYQFSEMVLLCMEAQLNSDKPAIVKTGLEFSPAKELFLRFGISGRPVQYTAGFGYSHKKITTDVAFSYHGNLGITPSVSIQFTL